MSRVLYTSGTGSTQTTNQSETYKLPIYDSEQDVIDDLANLEVGDLVATDDPSESETIATLITKIQELEERVENSKKKYTGSFIFRSNGGNNGTSFTVNETVPAGRYLYELKTALGSGSRISLGINSIQDGTTYRVGLFTTTDGGSNIAATGIIDIENPTDTFYQYGYQFNNSDTRTVYVEIVPLSL